jgi:hypothetical protein
MESEIVEEPGAIRTNLIVWGGLIVVVGVTFFFWRCWPAWSLASHPAHATGTVSAKWPHKHGQIDFTYVVDGREYPGACSGDDLGKPFEDVRIGDQVAVTYDLRHPGTNSVKGLLLPRVATAGELVALCAILPVAIMIMLHFLGILPRWRLFDL